MGYVTFHTLTVMLADNSAEHPDMYEIIAALRRENENANHALDDEGQTLNEAKWYESSEEMKEFSLKYPHALLVMDGDGEGSDDFWVAYYLNGKEQMCPGRREYDDFDAARLA